MRAPAKQPRQRARAAGERLLLPVPHRAAKAKQASCGGPGASSLRPKGGGHLQAAAAMAAAGSAHISSRSASRVGLDTPTQPF